MQIIFRDECHSERSSLKFRHLLLEGVTEHLGNKRVQSQSILGRRVGLGQGTSAADRIAASRATQYLWRRLTVNEWTLFSCFPSVHPACTKALVVKVLTSVGSENAQNHSDTSESGILSRAQEQHEHQQQHRGGGGCNRLAVLCQALDLSRKTFDVGSTGGAGSAGSAGAIADQRDPFCLIDRTHLMQGFHFATFVYTAGGNGDGDGGEGGGGGGGGGGGSWGGGSRKKAKTDQPLELAHILHRELILQDFATVLSMYDFNSNLRV